MENFDPFNLESPNDDARRRRNIINDIKCRIKRVYVANDQNWYIGEDRVTYQTIAVILNRQFYNGVNPITGSPFDGQFIIEVMTAHADFFERISPPTDMEAGDDIIKTFAPDAIPYKYSISTHVAPSLWQKYEDDCLDWLLKKDNSHVQFHWGDSVEHKLQAITREIHRISHERQWPITQNYCSMIIRCRLDKLSWVERLYRSSSRGRQVFPPRLVPVPPLQNQGQGYPLPNQADYDDSLYQHNSGSQQEPQIGGYQQGPYQREA